MDFRKVTLKDLLGLSDQDINNMPTETVKKYVTKAAGMAKSARTTSLKAFNEEDFAYSQAYADWSKSDVIRSKRDRIKFSGSETGDMKSWVTLQFDNPDAYGTPREQLKTIIRFLATKTRTKAGVETYKEKFQERLLNKIGIKELKPDALNEFWRIVQLVIPQARGTEYAYKAEKNGVYISYTTAKSELQELVLSEMQKDPFNGVYNKELGSNDSYAQKIAERVGQIIQQSYEEKALEEKRREEEMETIGGFTTKLTRRGL